MPRSPQARATACYQRYLDALPESAEIHESIAEALLYLATRLKQQKQLQAAQSHLVRLLDFAGPEKLEAQAMCVSLPASRTTDAMLALPRLREIRALADSAVTTAPRR